MVPLPIATRNDRADDHHQGPRPPQPPFFFGGGQVNEAGAMARSGASIAEQ